ncbi:TonB-dependent siderophore receptor [Rufibacter sp. LB8]|uniref:TonB-dependent receptor plug domain-containing protein n=1 Tax=Rufibacter sp. LB8 TaxID=2777781 RepID=UPI00178C1817|nr:TonB-dependent receptor [Rufibacter sp. LB8]
MTQRVHIFQPWLWLALLLLAAAPAVLAQTHLADSVALSAVTVQGNKYSRFAAGSRTQALDTFLLQRQPGLTLAEALQQRSPLYLKSYGNGMTATVAFRGTNASHTAVLWNGFNIALPTLGMSDFALLPPGFNTQVSLQHGPSGALHGSGAIGGAVLLENPVSFQPQQKVEVYQQLGSFGQSRSSAAGTFATNKLSLSTSFSRSASDNNFRFRNTTAFGTPEETQQNAAFDQTNLAQEAHFKLSETQRVSLRGWYVTTDRQIQPSMGSANTHARQKDKNLRLMGEWQGVLAGGVTTVRGAWFKDRLDYQDDGVLSLSTVNTYQSQVEHERQLTSKLLLQLGAEGQLFKAQVGGYGGTAHEKRFSGYGWLRYDPVTNVEISLNVRQAWVQGFSPPVTPTLGVNYSFLQTQAHQLTAKANLSRSYRVPTLNDRFWRPGGNPNLNPETSWGYEGGLAHQFQKGGLRGTSELTVYALQVKDWIQWQPASQGPYSEPVNLQRVRGNGLEVDSRWNYALSAQTSLAAGLAYAYTVSEQKIPNAQAQLQARQLSYVPKHKVAGWAEVQFHSWRLFTDAAFTSLRFQDNDHNKWLKDYVLVNAGLGKTFSWRNYQANLLVQTLNATNTVYQTMAFRAMPPRQYQISLGLQWGANSSDN